MELFLTSAEERNLSCCINVNWPSAGSDIEPDPATAAEVAAAFDQARTRTGTASAWHEADEAGFNGWLAYPTARQAAAAARVLHEALVARGLGANQWTRELVIPRERA